MEITTVEIPTSPKHKRKNVSCVSTVNIAGPMVVAITRVRIVPGARMDTAKEDATFSNKMGGEFKGCNRYNDN